MCGGGGNSYNPPPPPAPPPAAPKPMTSPEADSVNGSGDQAASGGYYKKRGKDALKIDLSAGGGAGGNATGLNIPG